ncbi:hypothetical protein VP01_1162g10 [Puccinia sorghi]|uniref:DDE Tnp4 domain-containing protein n=1 Tax=Puccinia sorghi TaxID=27349 RepID=A0A0L6VRH2_9BASI|nr:hypothetical protein VP01_1162g10 [Puccinia sorghi]
MWLSGKLRDELAQDPLGHGSTYVTIGHVFNIGKETADKASGRFVKSVLKVFRVHAINFPPLDRLDQWAEIKQSFEARHGIPQIVGAIDGTHVLVSIPAHDNWNGYINRKSWASIVFQCVVDGEGNFCNVCGGGPGLMHDARVFRRSKLGPSLRAKYSTTPPMIPHGTFLVGDAGYPTKANILLPYPSVVSPSNQWFSFIQSSTRIVVERAFGRLKNRFRVLLNAQIATPVQARNTSFACMILHNILNRRGTLYLHDWDTRSDKEVIFAELPLPEPDALPRNLPVDGGHKVSMMTKRDIIRDMLYVPPQGTIS